jgi:hypothetical protein
MIDEGFIESLLAQLKSLKRRVGELETHEGGGYRFPFTLYDEIQPITGSPRDTHIGPVGVALTLRRFTAAVYVATTNNGSHYWTITLEAPTTGTLASMDTSAISANTWELLEDTTFASDEIDPGTDTHLIVRATKTGTPGNLDLGPELYVV